jgi:hypothetical protein
MFSFCLPGWSRFMGLGTRGPAMFKEGSPIAYDAPADLKK